MILMEQKPIVELHTIWASWNGAETNCRITVHTIWASWNSNCVAILFSSILYNNIILKFYIKLLAQGETFGSVEAP